MMRTAGLGTLRIVVVMLGGILRLRCRCPTAAPSWAVGVRAANTWQPRPSLTEAGFPAHAAVGHEQPEHKHRVRILFYGQSITGGWTDIVLKDLQARFPNADIVAENHALGGFAAPGCRKPPKRTSTRGIRTSCSFRITGPWIRPWSECTPPFGAAPPPTC